MALIYSGVPLMLPTEEVASWCRSNFTLKDITQFEYLAAPLKRRTQQAWSPEWRTDRPVRPQTLYWPKEASRCAIGNFIISQDNLDAIRKTLTTYAAKTLEMSWYDGAGKLVDQIRPSLYMLAATPVDVITGVNGLWLLTLVDERFFWWFKQSGSWDVTENTTTWANVFTSLGTELGSTITTDTIASAYLKPSGAFQHAATVRQPLPPVIDAACYNVGQRLVRTLGGNVQTQTPDTALASLQANLGTATANSPRAGGEFGYLASTKPNDLNAMVPASVKVYCQKANSEVPAKAWHEETVTLASLAMSEFAGVTGHLGSKIFHDTIVADYAGGGSALNATEITDLAKQIARDYYQWITLVSDRKFNGIVQMTPEGQSDAIEWLYGVNEVSTRVIPGAYTDEAVQLQHCSATYKSIDRTWLMIESRDGSKTTQRSFLQFRNNLTVSDDSTYDRTIVDTDFTSVNAYYLSVAGYLQIPRQPPPGGYKQGQIWMPGSGCSQYYYCDGQIKKVTGSVGVSSSGVGPHSLLSLTHDDTVAATPTLGDVVYANSTPAWTKLAGNTTSVAKFLAQTGTGAVSAAPSWQKIGMAYITTKTGSGAAVTFTDLTSAYAAYKVVFTGVAPATDNVSLYLRTSSNNGSSYDSGAGNYSWNRFSTTDGAVGASAGSTGDTQIIMSASLGNASNEISAGEVTIFNPSAAAYCIVNFDMQRTGTSTDGARIIGSGRRLAAADVDAIRFLFSSGNFAGGQFTLYGMTA